MIAEQKVDLIKQYEKDYFEKTGERIFIKISQTPEYSEVQKYVNGYICKYNVILGLKMKISSNQTDKLHLLRWKLRKKFHLTDKEIAYFCKCDRTSVLKSVKKVNSYIDTKDETFLSRFSLEISE